MTKILLVAGHGGGDPGACALGLREADLTRELALLVKKQLAGKADIFDTSLNLYKFLKNGGNFDFSKYDYVLELHFNAGAVKAVNAATTGCEMLIHSGRGDLAVDQKILTNISNLGLRNRGIKKREDLQNMNIMRKKGISYSLLEVCFIDDPDDMQIFKAKKNLIAEAIAKGIIDSFGIVSELESVNDIVWELASRGIITDKNLWLKKLKEDNNSYWLARKTVRYLKEKKI